jgi:hypothetical protein
MALATWWKAVSVAAKYVANLAGLWRCFRWQQPLPAFPRETGRTIRFWAFPCSGSSRKIKSPARQPASLVMSPLPSTSCRVVLVVRHLGPFAHCHQQAEENSRQRLGVRCERQGGSPFGGSEKWGHFGRPRVAPRTIRFSTFPCRGSSRKLSRWRANLPAW